MALTELRQRSAGGITNTNSGQELKNNMSNILQPGAGLSAKAMIDSSPQQHGVVSKLHLPILYSILPEFLQKIILSFSFLAFLGPAWKQRYLVLCGSFLYKFKDQTSEVPKGSPFELEVTNARLLSNGDEVAELGSMPPGFTSIIVISTLRKKHYYAVSDVEEARVWVRSINEAKQEAITRNMGHAAAIPYPQTWQYFDSLGKGLVKSKDRIREKMNEYSMREMEMSVMGEGGPVPRGFHGQDFFASGTDHQGTLDAS